MAHLVSTNRERLLAYGRDVGLPAERLQFKSLKDPRTGVRQHTWHWDLVGRFLPPAAPTPSVEWHSQPSTEAETLRP